MCVSDDADPVPRRQTNRICSGVGAAAAAAAMAAALLRQPGEVEGHCTCAVAANQLQLLD